jgi:hypothetical protein
VTGFIVDHMHENEPVDYHLPPVSDSSDIAAATTTIIPSFPSSTSSPSTSGSSSAASKTPDFLKVLTTPFTELVVQLDKKVLKGWATNDEKYVNATSILKLDCSSSSSNSSSSCGYLLSYLGPAGANLGEVVVGVVLLLVSLLMLCSCLIGKRTILRSRIIFPSRSRSGKNMMQLCNTASNVSLCDRRFDLFYYDLSPFHIFIS